jgi:hypothetical protein
VANLIIHYPLIVQAGRARIRVRYADCVYLEFRWVEACMKIQSKWTLLLFGASAGTDYVGKRRGLSFHQPKAIFIFQEDNLNSQIRRKLGIRLSLDLYSNILFFDACIRFIVIQCNKSENNYYLFSRLSSTSPPSFAIIFILAW